MCYCRHSATCAPWATAPGNEWAETLNNGTSQHEQQRWWKGAVANSPTNPDQLTNKLCAEKLEKEEQHTNWLVAAATHVNSTVQRNPKSKECGERNYWRQDVCVTKAENLDAAVGFTNTQRISAQSKILVDQKQR